MNSHSLAVHQGLGGAPAKADKLRVTKHRVQVLQQPCFGLRVCRIRKKTISMSVYVDVSTCIIYSLLNYLHNIKILSNCGRFFLKKYLITVKRIKMLIFKSGTYADFDCRLYGYIGRHRTMGSTREAFGLKIPIMSKQWQAAANIIFSLRQSLTHTHSDIQPTIQIHTCITSIHFNKIFWNADIMERFMLNSNAPVVRDEKVVHCYHSGILSHSLHPCLPGPQQSSSLLQHDLWPPDDWHNIRKVVDWIWT